MRCRLIVRVLLAAGLVIAGAAPAMSAAQTLAAAEQSVRSEHFAEAVTALEGMLQKDPHAGAEAYRLLAFAEYKLQQNAAAITASEQGLTLYPASQPLAELYVSLLRQGLPPEEQQAHLDAMAKRAPQLPVLLKARGEALLAQDPASQPALQLLASAMKRAPQDPEAHFFYGEAACFNKQDALCVRELTQAHALAPKNQYANMQLYTMIAVAEDRQRKPASAALAFARSFEANQQLKNPSPYAALKYVDFLLAQGKPKEAEPIIAKILEWDEACGPAHFERAKILAQQGVPEAAVGEAEQALKDARVSPAELRSYHAFLAKTYFALGRQSDAQIHQDWIEAHPAAGAEP